jgi:hypothetical protein
MALFQKIQLKLLLNHPLLFSTRVVPAIITGLSVNVILFLFFLVSPTQTESNSGMAGWTAFLVLCSIIGIIIYLVFLFRFNPFKVFGKKPFFQFFLQGLYIFLSISSFIAWPFMPRIASSIATERLYSREEIQADFEKAYLTAYQIEYDRKSAPYRAVSILVDTMQSDTLFENYGNNLIIVKSSDFIPSERFEYTEKISENSYLGYEKQLLICTDFPYEISPTEDFSEKIYRSLKDEKMNREQGEAILDGIFVKYIKNYNGEILAKDSQMPLEDFAYMDESPVCSKYRLSEMSRAMDKVYNRINTARNLAFLLRSWFYFGLYLTVLILIFRYMTVRTFLWTLLAGFLLFVFTVIFSIILTPGENGIIELLIFYYLLCLGLAISIFFSKSRQVFAGIGLNLSFLFLHLLPFLLTASFFADRPEEFYTWRDKESFMRSVEWIALGLLTASSLFFHSALYYRWYSLPEE